MEGIFCQQNLDINWHLIDHSSCKMLPAEEIYDVVLLAIVEIFRSSPQYFEGEVNTFFVFTDHNLKKFIETTRFTIKSYGWLDSSCVMTLGLTIA